MNGRPDPTRVLWAGLRLPETRIPEQFAGIPGNPRVSFTRPDRTQLSLDAAFVDRCYVRTNIAAYPTGLSPEAIAFLAGCEPEPGMSAAEASLIALCRMEV